MAHKRLLVRGLGTLLLWAMGTAHAGEFSYNGLLQTEIAVSTTGDRTQPLDAGTALDNDGRVLNTTALRLELEGTYAFDRRTHVTGRFRLWGDYTNQIDSAYNSDVDLFAGSDYPGNGGLLSLSSKNTIADIPELYFDATRSGFWVRAGKQQIAWGHSIGMRILDDMVSSLDTRRHGGTYGLASEEFLDERIGLFAVRGSWRVPDTEWELEGLISDWAPSFPFVAGSAYANLPGGILVNADDGIDDARDQPVYGLRVKGLVLDGRGELTFAWTRRPQSIGVLRFDPADLGILLSTGNLPLRAEFPRIDTIGGAFSYGVSADPLGPMSFFDGMIARVEAAYYMDKTFTNPTGAPIPFTNPSFKDDEWSVGIVLEKNHKFSADWPATFIVFEGWYRSKSDFNDRYQALDGHNGWSWLLLSVSQNLMRNEVVAAFTTAYDTHGGWFVQPAVTWKPRHDVQLDIYANYFAGGDNDVYGPLQPNKEITFRAGLFF